MILTECNEGCGEECCCFMNLVELNWHLAGLRLYGLVHDLH